MVRLLLEWSEGLPNHTSLGKRYRYYGRTTIYNHFCCYCCCCGSLCYRFAPPIPATRVSTWRKIRACVATLSLNRSSMSSIASAIRWVFSEMASTRVLSALSWLAALAGPWSPPLPPPPPPPPPIIASAPAGFGSVSLLPLPLPPALPPPRMLPSTPRRKARSQVLRLVPKHVQ